MKVHTRFHMVEIRRLPYHNYQENKTQEAARVTMAASKGEPFGPQTPEGQIEMLIVNPEAAQMFLDAPIHAEFDLVISPVATE